MSEKAKRTKVMNERRRTRVNVCVCVFEGCIVHRGDVEGVEGMKDLVQKESRTRGRRGNEG